MERLSLGKMQQGKRAVHCPRQALVDCPELTVEVFGDRQVVRVIRRGPI
jgi:hypothetical protein